MKLAVLNFFNGPYSKVCSVVFTCSAAASAAAPASLILFCARLKNIHNYVNILPYSKPQMQLTGNQPKGNWGPDYQANELPTYSSFRVWCMHYGSRGNCTRDRLFRFNDASCLALLSPHAWILLDTSVNSLFRMMPHALLCSHLMHGYSWILQ